MRSGWPSTALSKAAAASAAVSTGASSARRRRRISSTIGLSSTRSSLTLLDMEWLFLLSGVSLPPRHWTGGTRPPVFTALTAGLPLQNDFPDGDALVQGLAHVVNRQSGD